MSFFLLWVHSCEGIGAHLLTETSEITVKANTRHYAFTTQWKTPHMMTLSGTFYIWHGYIFPQLPRKNEQTFTIFLHFLLLTYTCTSMMLISACVVPVSLIRLCFWQFTNWTVQILICCSICFLYRVYPHLFGISVFLLSTLRLGFFFAALPRFSSPPHCHCWGSLFYRSHLLKLRAEDAFSV